ncbi:MAG: LysM peptidoglycan-binding domain-containing protein [Sedimentisphaerales bacterium]|nr:LysM peptidoglycan-binding domain-containing protein [Sedimentisphaerales bacterium]
MRSEWKIGIVVGVVLVVVLIVFQMRKDQSPPSEPGQPQDGTLMQVGGNNEPQQPNPPAPPDNDTSGTPAGPGPDLAGTKPVIEIVMPAGRDRSAEATGPRPVGGDDVVPALRQYTDLTEPIAVPEPAETKEPQYYVVQKNDNLSDISEKYYGHGRYWNEIYQANRGLIKNPDVLQVGWKLRIPYPEEIAARLEGAAPPAN